MFGQTLRSGWKTSSFLHTKIKPQVSLRVSGSNNRFTDLSKSARRGRQASYPNQKNSIWRMRETHLSIQCIKFHSSIYSRLTKGFGGMASAPCCSPSTQSPPCLPIYLAVQRVVFHLVLPARVLSHLLPCSRAPAARAVAKSLPESGGLLTTAGGQQDWNPQFNTWQVLWQSKSCNEETYFSVTPITSSIIIQKCERVHVHRLHLPEHHKILKRIFSKTRAFRYSLRYAIVKGRAAHRVCISVETSTDLIRVKCMKRSHYNLLCGDTNIYKPCLYDRSVQILHPTLCQEKPGLRGEEGRRGEGKTLRTAQLMLLKHMETASKSFAASTLPSSLIMVNNVAFIWKCRFCKGGCTGGGGRVSGTEDLCS